MEESFLEEAAMWMGRQGESGDGLASGPAWVEDS